MANGMEGLMSLPQGATDQGMGIDPELISPVVSSYAKNDPRSFNRDLLDATAQADPALIQQIRAELAQAQLSQEEIDAFRLAIDRILANPGDYETIRNDLLEQDFPEELLPPTFDGAFFQALSIVAETLQPAAQEPMTMAQGGLATLNPIAREMAAMGRNGDTMLAHITPQEAALLKSRGGSGTINPYTGLPEFFIGKIFKGIKKAASGLVKGVKSFLKSDIGRIVATIGLTMALGPGGFLGGTTGLGAAGTILGTGISSSVAVGVNAALAGTLVGVVSGQSLGDALKGGILSGVTAGVGAEVFGAPSGYGAQPDAAAAAAAPAPTAEVTVGAPEALPSTDVPTISTPIEQTAVSPTTGQVAVTSPVDIRGGPITQYEGYFPPAEQSIGTVGGGQGYADIRPFSPNGPSYQPSVMADRSVLEAAGAAPTPTTPALSPDVWDPNLGEYVREGVPLSQLGSVPPPPAVAPLGPWNMTAEQAMAARAPIQQQAEQGILDRLTSGAKSIYQDYLSPTRAGMEGKTASQYFTELTEGLEATAANRAAEPAAWQQALKSAAGDTGAGMIRRYAPLAATGLGIAALTGGFETEPAEMPEMFKGPTGQELLRQQPEKYGLQYGGLRRTTNPMAYMYQMPGYAEGGIATLAKGGDPSNFPRKNGHINGPGTGTSDDVPAMLSDGEFVFTAKAVRAMGNGSRRKGAKKMYALMKALEKRSA